LADFAGIVKQTQRSNDFFVDEASSNFAAKLLAICSAKSCEYFFFLLKKIENFNVIFFFF